MYSGQPVTLEELLDAREARAWKQKEWLQRHSLPLISFTINMVGEVKVNQISMLAFEAGREAILDYCKCHDVTIPALETNEANTGYELLVVCAGVDSVQLKKNMVEIEQEHPLGRLFDIDVIGPDGKGVSRDTLNLPRRPCIVCANDAKVCARSRVHSKDEIVAKMEALTQSFTCASQI